MARIQFKRSLTAAGWVASSVILAQGEPGAAIDTGETRIGDGLRTWASLPSTSGANKVGKGDLVFNVKDYGAVGNWPGGTSTGGTDDLAAINACFTAAAAAGPNSRVVFPRAAGYKVSGTVNVPAGVDVYMDAPIVYMGGAGQTALSVNPTGAWEYNRKFRLRARRPTISTWTDEADLGIRVSNQYTADLTIAEATNFTIGAQLIGESSFGFAYCTVRLGQLYDCKIPLDLTNDTLGWCNENVFIGGQFSNTSSTYTSTDRVAVRITSKAGTKYYNNANIFLKPSFEIRGGVPSLAAEGVAVLCEYGNDNKFENCRHESPDAVAIRNLNDSKNNSLSTTYDNAALPPVHDDAGLYSSSLVRSGRKQILDAATRLVHKVSNTHKSACYYDGSTNVHVPGLTFRLSSTILTDSRQSASVALNANYVELSSGMLGFYVSTRTMKRFTLVGDFEAGYGGRWAIGAYDSAGAVLSTAGTVRSDNSNPTYVTGLGGVWRVGLDSTAPRHFEVSAATDFIFVGVAYASSPVVRFRSVSMYTPDLFSGATWLAQPDNGESYGTTAPTAGTWPVGKRVLNAAPTTNGAVGWVCTTAGTPGTWRTYGDVTSGTAPQIDVFTSSGTWTKPAGAKSVSTVLIAGGNGGGSGRRGATSTIRCGGGGGGGGGMSFATYDPADLSGTVAVTVGVGGTGGAAVTTDDTSGNGGGVGTGSTFGPYGSASVGSAAGGGTATTGTAGGGGLATASGGAGGAASTTGLVGGGGSAAGGAGGAGSGGGISATNVAANGGNGATSRTQSGSTGGVAGVVDGSTPTTLTAPTTKGTPGSGGGGGAASITTAAQAGANGAGYGSGGGGGGASLNGNNSGAGGNGAPGYVLVVTTF